MKKIDYKQELKHLYRPSTKKVKIVNVPEMNFLMIDGKGDPNTSLEFKDAIDVLFTLSYTIKFIIKKSEIGIDYCVMPLEVLWWADNMPSFYMDNKENWNWTLMIMQPEIVTREILKNATERVRIKKNPISLPMVRFEPFKEGKVTQIMHMGPFLEEGQTIEKVYSFIENNGDKRRGNHHEIYLSDIKRTAPEKWKIIIRQPIL